MTECQLPPGMYWMYCAIVGVTEFPKVPACQLWQLLNPQHLQLTHPKPESHQAAGTTIACHYEWVHNSAATKGVHEGHHPLAKHHSRMLCQSELGIDAWC